MNSRRNAFTLIEVIIAMGLSSLLAVALGSVVMISMRMLRVHESPAAARCDSLELSSKVLADVKLATRFGTASESSMAFSVPDRDGDLLPEVIQYQWENEQLKKSIAFSTADAVPELHVIAEDVGHFHINWATQPTGQNLTPIVTESRQVTLYRQHEPTDSGMKELLMIVPGSGSPSTYSTMRQNLFQSWGYSVTFIGANESESAIASATVDADVIYICSGSTPQSGLEFLADLNIGIVSEDIDFATLLEIGTPVISAESLQFAVLTDDHHAAASPLVRGAFRAFDSAASTRGLSSSPSLMAPDALSLASWSADQSAMVALESGDRSFDPTPEQGTFGITEILADESNAPGATGAYRIVASLMTLDQPAIVHNLESYLDVSASAEVKFAIFANENGQPGTLLAETESLNLTADGAPQWTEIDLMEDLELNSGNYWLAIMLPESVSFYEEAASGSKSRWANFTGTTADGFPEVWAETRQSNQNSISIHANFTEIPVSAGRRLILPAGEADADFAKLSDTAMSLLKNSLQWAAQSGPGSEIELAISDSQSHLEVFQPTAIPATATEYSIQRIAVHLRPNLASEGDVQFSLFRAEDGLPVGDPITTSANVAVASISSGPNRWFEIPMPQSNWIAASQSVCIKVSSTESTPNLWLTLDNVTDGSSSTDKLRMVAFGSYRSVEDGGNAE